MAAPSVDLALEAYYMQVQSQGSRKYYMLASVVLLFYDLLTTLDIEIARIWSGKFSPFIVLWTLNRWLPVMAYIFIVWLAHHTTDRYAFYLDHMYKHKPWMLSPGRCNKLVTLVPSLLAISYTVIALIVILRTWAIYGQKLWPVILLGSVYVMALSVQTFVVATSTRHVSMPPGIQGCLLGAVPESSLRFLFFWIVALVFDTLLFALTLFKTLSIRKSTGLSTPLVSLLMRDGIIYFLVMFLANVMNVVLFVTAPPQLNGMNIYFSHITTVIMISHIMLNLKTYIQERGGVTLANPGRVTPGMSSSQMPSTDRHAHAQQPGSMLKETLERFGAPMMESREEVDGRYQAIIGLPMDREEGPHPSSGFSGPNRQWVSHIALAPLHYAPTQGLGSPHSPKSPMFNTRPA